MFGSDKNRMTGLSVGKGNLTICLAILTQYWRVTDGRNCYTDIALCLERLRHKVHTSHIQQTTDGLYIT